MKFIKILGAGTIKTAMYPLENLLSLDLTASTAVRMRFKSTVAKITAAATVNMTGSGATQTAASITITDPGGVYNAPPVITPSVASGNNTGVFTAVLTNGLLTGVTISGTANNYSATPTLSFPAATFATSSYDELRLTMEDSAAVRTLMNQIASFDGNSISLENGLNGISAIGLLTKGIKFASVTV